MSSFKILLIVFLNYPCLNDRTNAKRVSRLNSAYVWRALKTNLGTHHFQFQIWPSSCTKHNTQSNKGTSDDSSADNNAPGMISNRLMKNTSMVARLFPVVLVIGLCGHFTKVNSFSPSLICSSHNLQNSHAHGLAMSVAQDNHPVGKVVAQRSIYRFSPTESSVQTPYTIEERQYFSVAQDRSMEPISAKSLIFRGGSTDNGVKSEWSWRMNDDANQGNVDDSSRVFTKLGPALRTIEGLQVNDDQGKENIFAMALYCMENPELIAGEGLEVGR